jgi:hypothetical protein
MVSMLHLMQNLVYDKSVWADLLIFVSTSAKTESIRPSGPLNIITTLEIIVDPLYNILIQIQIYPTHNAFSAKNA